MNLKRAFTIVEVMLVVTIISVLSVVTISFVSLSRDRAKEAKVQQEKVLVKGVIDAYAAEHGGYPNPDPISPPKLYCVGSTDCVVKGHSVSDYIDPQTGSVGTQAFKLGDLISFTNESGDVSKGYVYASCGNTGATYCSADNSALLYPQSDDVWASYFENKQPDTSSSNLFALLGIDLSTYPLYNSGNTGDYTYSCRYSDYPTNIFSYVPSDMCLPPTVDSEPTALCKQPCDSVIGSLNLNFCRYSDYPNQTNAFEISTGICTNNYVDGYFCSDTCQNVVNYYPERCNYDNGSGCYWDGTFYQCRNNGGSCNGSGDHGGGGGSNPSDSDKDGIVNNMDNCPNIYNPDQGDSDGDGVGNFCDNCSLYNPDQTDLNNNGAGDACEE